MTTAAERFATRVDHDGPMPVPHLGRCWLWTGGTNGKYGVFWANGRQVYVHRWVYETEVGPIPEKFTIDHLCRTKLCVRASHLEAVTNRENVLRGTGPVPQRARQETCIHGHALDRRKPNGTRRCSTCGREAMRRVRERQRAQGA